MTASVDATEPDFAEQVRVFGRIGLFSFGGPAAQIALMHKTLVDEKQWLEERQFLNALSFCMLLPGPEAMQLATYSGWRLGGIRSGLMAGLLFVMPGALVIFALAATYAAFGQVPLVQALFLGVKAAVLIIVIEALLRVARKALKGATHWVVAAVAFTGIFVFSLPFPLIILAAAVFGFLANQGSEQEQPVSVPAAMSISHSALVIALGLVVWLLPLWMLDTFMGHDFLRQLGNFFAKLAVVTFGGAYAVLAYMAQDVVTKFGWLTAGEMMDGLGLAETTPGPLILVTQFVGFLAAFREGGMAFAFAGGVVALWATFVPCFIWIFAGAPYIEWICAQPRLRGALSAITAAVVGVILNLSLWFGLHVFFSKVEPVRIGWANIWMPDLTSLDWRVIILSTVSAVMLLYLHRGLVTVLAVAAVGGLLFSALG